MEDFAATEQNYRCSQYTEIGSSECPTCSCGTDMDDSQKLLAEKVCPQCGKCAAKLAPPSTAPSVSALPICEGSADAFVASACNNRCSHYARDGSDECPWCFQYCGVDMDDSQQLLADQVCPECGKCTPGHYYELIEGLGSEAKANLRDPAMMEARVLQVNIILLTPSLCTSVDPHLPCSCRLRLRWICRPL